MRSQTKFAMFVALLGCAAIPSAANAEDDNVFDGKTYAGAMCDSAISTVSSVRVNSLFSNSSGAASTVNCPIVQDAWETTTGLTYSRITVYNTGSFSCSESSFDINGTFLASRSVSTTSVGLQGLYFFNGTYLNKTGAEGSIMIQCTVPANAQIRSYQVQERAN